MVMRTRPSSSNALSRPSRASIGPSVAAFLVWALVGFSALAWVLQWRTAPGASAAPEASSAAPSWSSAELARSLGAQVTPVEAPALASRLRLLGVVQGEGRESTPWSAALMSVDGQPPKPFRLGQTVVDGQVVLSVQAREVVIGPSGATTGLHVSLPVNP